MQSASYLFLNARVPAHGYHGGVRLRRCFLLLTKIWHKKQRCDVEFDWRSTLQQQGQTFNARGRRRWCAANSHGKRKSQEANLLFALRLCAIIALVVASSWSVLANAFIPSLLTCIERSFTTCMLHNHTPMRLTGLGSTHLLPIDMG